MVGISQNQPDAQPLNQVVSKDIIQNRTSKQPHTSIWLKVARKKRSKNDKSLMYHHRHILLKECF